MNTDLKSLSKNLPEREYTFKIEIKGKVSAINYEGDFKARIPRNKEQSLIAKEKALLNAGFDATLSLEIKNLHAMVAYFRHTIINAPDWFVESAYGYDLFDINVLEDIYGKILEQEEKWMETIWGKSGNP